MSVRIVHPETGGSLIATEEQLAHLRLSGWVTAAEYAEQQAAQAPPAEAAAKTDARAPGTPAAKSNKTDEGR